MLEHLCPRFYVIAHSIMQSIVWCALPRGHEGPCADRDGKWETHSEDALHEHA